MKLLLDSCLSRQAAETTRHAGHDVVWAGDWPKDPGDPAILNRAIAERRILATLDKDFGELAIVQGLFPMGMIRLVGFRARDQGPALLRIMDSYGKELGEGAILTVEPWRVRIRLATEPPG